eukprot:XP_780846.2 PREDICTED: SOSS complex subunit C [Strongylocentrotus purpuratus]
MLCCPLMIRPFCVTCLQDKIRVVFSPIEISIKMSAPGSSASQVNRMAILEDLQEKKKRMSARMQSTGPGGGATMQMKDNGMGLMRDPQEAQMSANKQQQALQHAHTNSSAYFITQDSSFGNLILPVIPRIPPPVE